VGQSATGAEFARRIDAEPGLLDSCDSGGDRFGVLYHAAAVGRLDLIQMILERGVSVDTPSGTPEEYADTEADRPKFEPGFTPQTGQRYALGGGFFDALNACRRPQAVVHDRQLSGCRFSPNGAADPRGPCLHCQLSAERSFWRRST
jgi:hypothetical protein